MVRDVKKIIQEVGEKLRSKEYKLTPQRQQILEVMLENKEKHLSAEDVYNLVKMKAPDVGMATVYRTLELFLEHEIIHSVNFGDGRKRYEYGNNCDGHHHHHAICLSCGKILEINEDLLDELEKQVARDYGFEVTDHELKIYGRCGGCKGKD